VPAFECFGAVANGTAQMGHDASYYHTGKTEGAAFFTAFPFGFTAAEMDAWMKFGNGQKLWDELYAPFGLRGFHAGSTGTQMFGWFRKPIRSLADLQGLKFRAPGNQGRVLQKLGVTPVSLPGGEIFPALQSGAIDGAEWIGPYNDLALGFYQVCRHYYSPGYHEPGPMLQLTVNEQAWRTLDAELQAIVRTAADAATRDVMAEYNAREARRDRAALAAGRAARLRPRLERRAERDPCRGLVAEPHRAPDHRGFPRLPAGDHPLDAGRRAGVRERAAAAVRVQAAHLNRRRRRGNPARAVAAYRRVTRSAAGAAGRKNHPGTARSARRQAPGTDR
jgi:Bacterial extracellular solute-binding protein, family 7